jgi:hypothetical protein
MPGVVTCLAAECAAYAAVAADLFASTFPTVVMYVIDTPRCTAPQTFISNMLQAVSILYKTKLPMLLVRAGEGCRLDKQCMQIVD